MLKQIYIGLFIVLFSLSIQAQKIGKPTLDPTDPTTAQQKLIEEGISLHDRKMYDQAIAKYQQVLKENPDCVLAIYEMALSYYNKKDYSKASEVGYILVKYKGKTGILGYGLIANILDDQGKPKEAIEIYKSAIKQLEKDLEYRNHLSSLHYNLGVTYTRQKQYKEAREALKKAVEQDFTYASPNYLLGEVFYGTKYKVPALLSAARLISLEINSTRTKRSVAIFLDVLKPASKDDKGNISIPLDFNAPKDEGDLAAFDLFLGTLTSVKTEEDKGKSDNEMFADAVGTLIALLEEDKKLGSTFIGKTYIPFMSEMKKKGFVKHFAYLVLQQNGDKDAEKWLIDEGQKTIDFINWAKSYQLK